MSRIKGYYPGVVSTPLNLGRNRGSGGTEPPPSGESVILVNQRFVGANYPQPLNYDLVKVTIDATVNVRMDGALLGAGCSGRIGRIEIDTWNADCIHIGVGAHDLVFEGGYIANHGIFDPAVHIDGIQCLGGQRVTFKNMDLNLPFATNSPFFVSMGQARQELPTDIILDGCTVRRSPEDNRTLRIYESLRSGAKNSTIYWCGTGPGCGAGNAIATIPETQELVDINNTFPTYT